MRTTRLLAVMTLGISGCSGRGGCYSRRPAAGRAPPTIARGTPTVITASMRVTFIFSPPSCGS
jgi:hypothetical protein